MAMCHNFFVLPPAQTPLLSASFIASYFLANKNFSKSFCFSLRFLLFMKVLVPKPIWTQAVVNRKILAAVLVDIGFRKLRTRAPFVKCQAKSNPRFYQKDDNENLSSKLSMLSNVREHVT